MDDYHYGIYYSFMLKCVSILDCVIVHDLLIGSSWEETSEVDVCTRNNERLQQSHSEVKWIIEFWK